MLCIRLFKRKLRLYFLYNYLFNILYVLSHQYQYILGNRKRAFNWQEISLKHLFQRNNGL